MTTETKYLLFDKRKLRNKKTYDVCVVNKNSLTVLGHIQWWGAWRKYCFFPEPEMVFDHKCLNDIADYLNELMEERKQK